MLGLSKNASDDLFAAAALTSCSGSPNSFHLFRGQDFASNDIVHFPKSIALGIASQFVYTQFVSKTLDLYFLIIGQIRNAIKTVNHSTNRSFLSWRSYFRFFSRLLFRCFTSTAKDGDQGD